MDIPWLLARSQEPGAWVYNYHPLFYSQEGGRIRSQICHSSPKTLFVFYKFFFLIEGLTHTLYIAKCNIRSIRSGKFLQEHALENDTVIKTKNIPALKMAAILISHARDAVVWRSHDVDSPALACYRNGVSCDRGWCLTSVTQQACFKADPFLPPVRGALLQS